MLFQMFNAINSRSDERSAFVHLFMNGWLWTPIGGSIALQALVVYAISSERLWHGRIDCDRLDVLFRCREFGVVAERSEQAGLARRLEACRCFSLDAGLTDVTGIGSRVR